MKLKTRVNLCIIAVWCGALLALASNFLGTWSLWAGIALVVVAGICRYTLVCCPRCGHKLVNGQKVPPHCPNCGEELE